MSQLCCPLCGRFVGLKRFDPTDFEDDIYGVEMRGLGRGRGFAVSEQFSLLDDRELMDLIAARCIKILNIIEEGERPRPSDVETLKSTLEAWKAEALKRRGVEGELRVEIERLELLLDESEEGDDSILAQINEALSDLYEDEFEGLASAVEALIVEYNEALEEAEDLA